MQTSSCNRQAEIAIDIPRSLIKVADEVFEFALAEMKYRLNLNKGLHPSYEKFGRDIWRHLSGARPTDETMGRSSGNGGPGLVEYGLEKRRGTKLEW